MGNRVNWTALALVTSIATAIVCIATALLAHGGHLFVAALAAGTGIAASAAYAGLALRAAERSLAKLSEELTAQGHRLLRLEARGEPVEPAALAQEVEAVSRATGALADALETQDARLRALEKRSATAWGVGPPETPAGSAEPSVAHAVPPEEQAVAGSPKGQDPVGPALSGRLATREDFARAASAILGRLAPGPLHVIQTPEEDAVIDDLEAGRLELWLQPVVTLPQRQVRLYAARPQLRDREGQPLATDIIRPILERRRRLERLDAFALSQALHVAAHLASRDRDTAVALRLSRESLASAAFLDGAARRLADDRAAASRLVLAFHQADVEAASSHEEVALGRLRGLGAGLAITALPSLDQDWASLVRRGFGHAMIAAGRILSPRPHATTAFLVAEAARAGVVLVATGIERERQIPDLLDFEVPFAVGDAISPARPVRADVLAPQVSSAPPAADPAVQDGRTSFREFLRRAG